MVLIGKLGRQPIPDDNTQRYTTQTVPRLGPKAASTRIVWRRVLDQYPRIVYWISTLFQYQYISTYFFSQAPTYAGRRTFKH